MKEFSDLYALKPQDISDDMLGWFLAVFMETKPDILDKTLQISSRVSGNKNQIILMRCFCGNRNKYFMLKYYLFFALPQLSVFCP